MLTLRPNRGRVNQRRVPIAWRESAWPVPIVVRSAAPVFRRLADFEPVGRTTCAARGLALPARLAKSCRKKSGFRPLRGKVANRRPLVCDLAAMRRLSAFAALPLGCATISRVRVFRFFQHPQFAL